MHNRAQTLRVWLLLWFKVSIASRQGVVRDEWSNGCCVDDGCWKVRAISFVSGTKSPTDCLPLPARERNVPCGTDRDVHLNFTAPLYSRQNAAQALRIIPSLLHIEAHIVHQ